MTSATFRAPSDIHPKQERIIRRARVPRCWLTWGLLWSHQSQAEQIGLSAIVI